MLKIMFVFLLFCVTSSPFSSAAQLNQGYPVCAENAYGVGGRLDVETMLYNCSDNIPGAMMIPSLYPYENGTFHPVNVSVQLVLNNLISIDDVTSEVRLDFWFRNFWDDPRWYMPDMWQYLNPECLSEGLDITQYVNRGDNALPFWLPDIEYFQGTEIEYYGNMIRIFTNGSVFWSRHAVVTLSQAQMSLKKFPMDTQNFSLTFQSFSYDGNMLVLGYPADGAVKFNYDSEQDQTYIKLNQLWTYLDYTAYSVIDPSPVVTNPYRTYSTMYVNIAFQRQSFGIIFRLALPVTIFLVIVGFSFWADIEKRIDVTLQMLLIVAALYLIIGQVIPFVGYLTTMDTFITSVFLILSLTIGVHFVVLLLDRKSDKYPLNSFHRDAIVYFFKAVWVPFAISVLVIFFDITETLVLAVLYASVVICMVNVFSKSGYLLNTFKKAILDLRKKKEKVELQSIEISKLTPSQIGLFEHVVIPKCSKFELFLLKFTANWYNADVLSKINDIETTSNNNNNNSGFMYDDKSRLTVNGVELNTFARGGSNMSGNHGTGNTFHQNVFASQQQQQQQQQRARDNDSISINPLGLSGSVATTFKKSIDQIVDSDDEDGGDGARGGGRR